WDEKPMEHETKPRIRNYREKTRPGAINSQQQQKEKTKQEHLRSKRIEQQTLEKYMQGNEIHLDQLPVIEPYVRKMLINWVGKAMMRKDRTFQTEHGRMVKVRMSKDERIILRAEDGDLEMPKVTFQFVDEVSM